MRSDADDWEQRPLTQWGTWLSGGTPSKKNGAYWGGDLPWVGPKDLHQRFVWDAEEYITAEGAANGTRTVPPNTTLIVVRSMALAKGVQVSLTQREVAFNQDIKAIVPSSDVDAHFLFYALWGNSKALHALVDEASHGTKRLRSEVLGALTISLPPLMEQRRIARVAALLDDKIESNRRIAATLEEIAATLFKARFVDFVDHDDLVESEIGLIPRGWSLSPLGDVIDELEVGKRPKGGVTRYSDGIPSIGAESIVGLGRFDYSKVKFVPEEFFKSMQRGHVQDRDVLLYKDGGRPGEFEPHVTMTGDGFPFETFAINEHVYRLRAVPELGQMFLFFWLSSDIAMAEMRVKGTGVAIPGLNSTQLRSLAILIPPPPVVRDFERVAEVVVSRVFSACKESRALSVARDALLPKLISGQIRVPPDAFADEEAD